MYFLLMQDCDRGEVVLDLAAVEAAFCVGRNLITRRGSSSLGRATFYIADLYVIPKSSALSHFLQACPQCSISLKSISAQTSLDVLYCN